MCELDHICIYSMCTHINMCKHTELFACWLATCQYHYYANLTLPPVSFHVRGTCALSFTVWTGAAQHLTSVVVNVLRATSDLSNHKQILSLVGRASNSYQSLISEGVVDASNEKPEGPQVLEPELQHKVGQQN